MKKSLAIILGVLFVMSFAASAFAIHAEIPSETQAVVATGGTQITLGGELRVRGWYLHNISDARLPVDTNSWAYYDQRLRLSVDAKVSPNVEGFVQLESGAGNRDNSIWGTIGGAKGTPDFNAKPDSISILQAWIMYSGAGLFGFPSGVKIGHMPLALGQQEFFDHTHFGDDAIVFFMLPTKELEIDLLTIKFAEQSTAAAGNGLDLDGYVGIVSYKLDEKNTIGVNYTYLNSPAGVVALGVNPKFKLQDIGVTANGNISGLGYKVAADFQFGKVADGVKAKGWAALLGLNYMFDPINVRAGLAYGSGDDNPNDSDVKQFITFLGPDQHYTLVYDYQLATTAGARFTGISNTTYLNLGLDVTPVKDLSASVDGYLIRASKTVGGVSKSAGWEVDGKVAYSLAKNLKYQVDAGYFKAGNFYEDTIGEKKGATVLRHSITLSF